MKRTRFDAAMDKKAAVKTAEANGEIADSMEVRMELMERVRTGEITLEDAQAELQRIKRNAKKSGKVTRAQAWRRG